MAEGFESFQMGDAAVRIFNAGMLRAVVSEWYAPPADEWPAAYRAALAAPLQVPVQCIYIGLPYTSVLVDAGTYDPNPDSPFTIPGYVPPPPLLDQLTAAGIRPESVEHVVITHAHFDHYNAVAVHDGQEAGPAFPNAQVYLGRGDWESAAMQAAWRDPGSQESQTFGLLRAHGRLQMVDGDREVAPGVHILATPGETPGHQAVRVASGGRSLYCLGDLVHHEVEVVRLKWAVSWADAPAAAASRRRVFAQAAAEDALLIATHITGIGSVRGADSGWVWQERAI